ncbi:hypothetical protein, partial [Nostoc sp.]
LSSIFSRQSLMLILFDLSSSHYTKLDELTLAKGQIGVYDRTNIQEAGGKRQEGFRLVYLYLHSLVLLCQLNLITNYELS